MNQIWTIAKRELGSFFDSLMAYIMMVAFLGFSGFFTWIFGTDIFFVKQARLTSFFGIIEVFFVTSITVSSLLRHGHSNRFANRLASASPPLKVPREMLIIAIAHLRIYDFSFEEKEALETL